MSSSLLPTFSSLDITPPIVLGCATMKHTLTHTGSLSLCCYSNLAACPLSPSSLCGCGKKTDCPCVSASGIKEDSETFVLCHNRNIFSCRSSNPYISIIIIIYNCIPTSIVSLQNVRFKYQQTLWLSFVCKEILLINLHNQSH